MSYQVQEEPNDDKISQENEKLGEMNAYLRHVFFSNFLDPKIDENQ